MGVGADDTVSQLRARIASMERGHAPRESAVSVPSERFRDKELECATEDTVNPHASSVAGTKGAEKAFCKIRRLSLMREQASVALRDRLAREGFSEEDAAEAVDRALRCGLVDDLRFAEVLMRSRAAAGRGRQGIEAELRRLNIEPSDVPGWPEEFVGDDDSEVARAIALLDKKPPQAKNLRDAAYRRLVHKGFSSACSSSAARLWSEGRASRL